MHGRNRSFRSRHQICQYRHLNLPFLCSSKSSIVFSRVEIIPLKPGFQFIQDCKKQSSFSTLVDWVRFNKSISYQYTAGKTFYVFNNQHKEECPNRRKIAAQNPLKLRTSTVRSYKYKIEADPLGPSRLPLPSEDGGGYDTPNLIFHPFPSSPTSHDTDFIRAFSEVLGVKCLADKI